MTRAPAPFIVGVPRSGTTLLRMMLDAHSELAIPPETDFGPAMRVFEERGAEAAVEAIVGHVLWGDYGLPAAEFARRARERRPGGYADLLRVFYGLYAESRGKPRWGDKTPRHLHAMTLVQEVLPEARFVHVVRDGRDVALSTVPVWFGPDDVAGAARRWSRMLTAARRQSEELRFYTEVRYEDLVRDPAPVLLRLCEFLELEWEPAMLEYHRNAAQRLAHELRDVRADGRLITRDERLAVHRLVVCPPRPERAGRWRVDMAEEERRAFDEVASETLRAFGYGDR